jgi:hypothetical protein
VLSKDAQVLAGGGDGGLQEGVDLAKAHPRILASLLGDTDEVEKFVKEFAENAEAYCAEIMQTCGVDYPTAKNLINSACYDGIVAAWMERENVAFKPPEFAYCFTNNIVHARNYMLGIPCFKVPAARVHDVSQRE